MLFDHRPLDFTPPAAGVIGLVSVPSKGEQREQKEPREQGNKSRTVGRGKVFHLFLLFPLFRRYVRLRCWRAEG